MIKTFEYRVMGRSHMNGDKIVLNFGNSETEARRIYNAYLADLERDQAFTHLWIERRQIGEWFVLTGEGE